MLLRRARTAVITIITIAAILWLGVSIALAAPPPITTISMERS